MKPEKAKLVVEGLKEAGVDFTAGVPDAQFIQVYKMLEEDPVHSLCRHRQRSRSRRESAMAPISGEKSRH